MVLGFRGVVNAHAAEDEARHERGHRRLSKNTKLTVYDTKTNKQKRRPASEQTSVPYASDMRARASGTFCIMDKIRRRSWMRLVTVVVEWWWLATGTCWSYLLQRQDGFDEGGMMVVAAARKAAVDCNLARSFYPFAQNY